MIMQNSKPRRTRSLIALIDVASAALLLAVALLLRLYNQANTLKIFDESYFQAYSFGIIGNNWLWPTKFMSFHPPLLPYILSVSTVMFSGDLSVFRSVSAITGSLSIVVTYFLGKKMFDRRVGLLAGILLAFEPFYIQIGGRIAILEPTLNLFMYLSIYFFWRGYFRTDGLREMAVAGLFLGLASDTKYAALLLYLIYLVFMVWDRKNFRVLLERKVLLGFAVSLVVFGPVLLALQQNGLGLNTLLSSLYGRKLAPSNLNRSYSVLQYLWAGFYSYVSAVTGYPSMETYSLPWYSAFAVATFVIAPAAVLYALGRLIKRNQAPAFLAIFFLFFNGVIAVFLPQNPVYFAWSLPAFEILLSFFAFSLFKGFRLIGSVQLPRAYPSFAAVRIVASFLIGLIVFSVCIAGTFSPIVDRGGPFIFRDPTGMLESAQFIKEQARAGDLVALDKDSMVMASPSIFGPARPVLVIEPTLVMVGQTQVRAPMFNLDLIEQVKPRFVLLSDDNDDPLITQDEWTVLYANYRLVFQTQGLGVVQSRIWSVFERIGPAPSTSSSAPGSIEGSFLHKDLSSASLPPVLNIGQDYAVPLWIENNGTSTNTYLVWVGGAGVWTNYPGSPFPCATIAILSTCGSGILILNPGTTTVVLNLVPISVVQESTVRILLKLVSGPLLSNSFFQDSLAKRVTIKQAFESPISSEASLIVAALVILIGGLVLMLFLRWNKAAHSTRQVGGNWTIQNSSTSF